MVARYRALFSVPGFSRLLVGSVLGRMPSGMFSLAILLFVRERTGSFLAAGLAVGAFTLTGAMTGPLLGALVDRLGQTRVLLTAVAGQATLLLALVLVAQRGAPATAIVAVAALAGSVLPPIAGCVRALWSEVANDAELLETAYALDATAQEIIWTLGPLLAGSVAGFVSPTASVLLCAAIAVAGTVFFATSTLSRHWRADVRERSRWGALASPGLRTLLGSVMLAGVVIGAVEVGLPALAVRLGSRWSTGVLLALFSLGSMTGGLLYSARSWRPSIERRYATTLLVVAISVAPLIAVHSLAAGLLLSVIAGLGIAPMLSCQFSLVGALAPAGTRTEAFTWHRAATVGGIAGGSALGGSLVDTVGVSASFALGCAGVALACALVALGRGRIEPVALATE
ncbi:MAG TPA: MFS transporter [Solirubrobacteraceae bacterium]|nr:MFS transporter [Solirubrobacteraceae bacterium]